ncbi:MAG: hypothetical protein LUQ50_14730, partial [Methanospirillum sp.]|uniref:hypothetical protein n=1 Tax=Methanospirillum sp. TaxID=45200 RepID=UPI002374CDA4
MPLIPDVTRARDAAVRLMQVKKTSELLLHPDPPDYSPPDGLIPGSLEHIIFITLTLSIDHQGDTPALWESSRAAYKDDKTRYLFSPDALYHESPDQVALDLKNTGICTRKKRDAENWRNIGVSISQRWGGDPRNFIACFQGNVVKMLEYMKTDKQDMSNDFPKIITEKSGIIWIRTLRDAARYDMFRNLDKIPVLPDIHITRASVALGVLSGKYSGQLSVISQKVREIWKEAVDQGENPGDTITALD